MATIGGGINNRAGFRATVGGGLDNNAGGSDATVGGGNGNIASGDFATVPGGLNNAARGVNSLAAGVSAKANHNSTIVLAASISPSDTVASSASGQMVLMANGRFYMTNSTGVASIPAGHFLETSTGAYLTDVGVWTNASSQEYKSDIKPLENEQYAGILQKLEKLNVVHFRYKADPEREHIGLIAEEVPEEMASVDRKGIPTADAIAFLMAALKAQQSKIQELEKILGQLKEENERR